MKDIQTHIDRDTTELFDALANGQSQRARHLSDELEQLETYQKNHPEDDHDPTPIELFCDRHPSSPECLIYDD